MNWQQVKFLLSRPPRSQIQFVMSTYIDEKLSKKFYGKSLVGNFLQILYTQMAANDSTDFPASAAPWSSVYKSQKTSGATQSTYSVVCFTAAANTGEVNRGLILGSGTTTPAAADYTVETFIAHGTGASQISYQSQTATQGCTIVDLVTSFILQRVFINTSGGQIDVNEICLYSNQSSYIYMLYRDVLSSTDEIPDGSTYRVTLEISVTT